MDEIAQKIELYHNLFLGCLALCILCFLIAIVLFFVLDISSVLGYLTGRRAKKQIHELEEANAASGRLMARERSNMQYVAPEMKQDMGVRSSVTPGARKVEHVIEESRKDVDAQPVSGAEETSLLMEAVGSQETTLLKQQEEESQTTVLQENDGNPEKQVVNDGPTAVLQEAAGKLGVFKIEREIILIHAEEVI